MLEIDGVAKRFGGIVALGGVSFNVPDGEICGLVGPNGSGKSTLFDVISALTVADRGQVRINGQDVTGGPPERVAALGVGRTFQIVRPLPGLTCVENLLPGLLYGGGVASRTAAETRAEELLGLVGLFERREAFGRDLTLWQRKLLELARALAVGSRLLLLDEVFGGLGPADVDRIVGVIARAHAELDLTVVIVEHVMRAVTALCERLVVLSFGEVIADGPVDRVLGDPKVLEVYLGTPLEGAHAC